MDQPTKVGLTLETHSQAMESDLKDVRSSKLPGGPTTSPAAPLYHLTSSEAQSFFKALKRRVVHLGGFGKRVD